MGGKCICCLCASEHEEQSVCASMWAGLGRDRCDVQGNRATGTPLTGKTSNFISIGTSFLIHFYLKLIKCLLFCNLHQTILMSR